MKIDVTAVIVFQIDMYVSFPFGLEGGMWDLIISMSDNCCSDNFTEAFFLVYPIS